jgi:hypothetical protein
MSKPLPNRPEQAAERKPAPAAQAPKPKAPRKPSPWPWGAWRRALVSLFVAFHVVAVFSAPWFIQLSDVFEPALPPGRVPRDAQGQVIPLERLDPGEFPPVQAVVPQAIAGARSRFPLIWHYANLLYINNGYDFFSPDPSFSQLLRYEVFDDAGQTIAKGELPDRRDKWPRLFYHRHMMLVDQSADPRTEGLGWREKIADRLLKVHGGARVRLVTVRHDLLTQDEVLDGRRINEESTYTEYGEPIERVRQTASKPGTEGAVAIPGGAR